MVKLGYLIRDDKCRCQLDRELARVETTSWVLDIDAAWHRSNAEILTKIGKLCLPDGTAVMTLGEFYDGILGDGAKPNQTMWVAAYLRKLRPEVEKKIDDSFRLDAEVIKLKMIEADGINQEGLEAQSNFLIATLGEKEGKKRIKELIDKSNFGKSTTPWREP